MTYVPTLKIASPSTAVQSVWSRSAISAWIDELVEVANCVDPVGILERAPVEYLARSADQGGEASAGERGTHRHPSHPDVLELAEGKAIRSDAGDIVDRSCNAVAGQT